jgi:crossover junction endodeoxyribonuclease RuvC
MAKMDPTPTTHFDRVLGIDPGLNTTGYGVVEASDRGVKLIEAGVVRSTAKRSLPDRVREIHEGVAEVIANLEPHAVAIEELYSHYERPRTAILMGHARGVICLAAASANLDIHHYAATNVKKMVTGSGRAPKTQVQAAIQREFGLKEPPEPNDVADALAIALCHVFTSRTLLAR